MAADEARRSRNEYAHFLLFPHPFSNWSLCRVKTIACEGYTARAVSVQLFRLNLNVLLASGLLLPVLLYPGLEGLACRCVPAAERESRNIGVGDVHLCRRIRWDDADE